MKKTYIIPAVKSINLSTEENVLAATSSFSINEGTGEIDGGMSNKRTASEDIWGNTEW